MTAKKIYKRLLSILWELSHTVSDKRLFERERLVPIIAHNRFTLNKVKKWIDDSTLRNSHFRYGIPGSVEKFIDLAVGDEVTYSDVIVYLSRFLRGKVNYVELGVSVGKNVFQVMNSVSGSTITCFDLERINPTLEEYLSELDEQEGSPPERAVSNSHFSMTKYEYRPNQNIVHYLTASVLEEQSWKELSGRQFNLMFSDARHEPEAIVFECDMMVKYNVLDEKEFIIIWDDLGGEMTLAFKKVWEKLRNRYGLNKEEMMIYRCRGWLGVHEPNHIVGIVTHFYKQKEIFPF